jgi:hypothetical protein
LNFEEGMDSRKVVLEVCKWLYGFINFCNFFLFFCLILDVVCYLIGGGWNPLLGQWPVFSGTLSAVVYSDWFTVVFLLLGVAVIARLVIWDRTPGLLRFIV